MKNWKSLAVIPLIMISACKKEETDPPGTDTSGPRLVFKFKFDPDQERLNNFGQPSSIPAEHGAQTPDFNGMSAHYIELAPSGYTPLGEGEVVFYGAETNVGGEKAVDFSKAIIKGDGEVFYSIPLSQVATGNYQWARVSLAYQNFDINFRWDNVDYTGTLASFVAYRSYINTYKIKTASRSVNANKDQGYWGFEATYPVVGAVTIDGQAQGTTVPNPLFDTSPIPAGSCVVTGQFENGLTITGNETEDIVVTLSFSINDSFEWYDVDQDNIYETQAGDYPVDMGIRGLIPIVEP